MKKGLFFLSLSMALTCTLLFTPIFPNKLESILKFAKRDLNNLDQQWQLIENDLNQKLETIQSSFVRELLISKGKRLQAPIEQEIKKTESLIGELEEAIAAEQTQSEQTQSEQQDAATEIETTKAEFGSKILIEKSELEALLKIVERAKAIRTQPMTEASDLVTKTNTGPPPKIRRGRKISKASQGRRSKKDRVRR